MRAFPLIGLLVAAAVRTTPAHAQGIDLTVNDVGLEIGNKPDVTGLRLDFRDSGLDRVRGINATVWSPYQPVTGVVEGLALGLPVTGARDIKGVALGVLGAGADHSITGIGIGGLGLGAGGEVSGLMIGGLGIGAGGQVRGIVAGGLGVGAGGGITGLAAGGLGVGTGGRLTGIAVGGLGVGAGEGLTGLAIGGVGVGAGGNITGLTIGGIGVGAGGDVTGITLAGVGVGAGGRLHGLTLAGIGIGANRIDGVAGALAVGAVETHAIILAPAYFKLVSGGSFTGASLSAVNYLRGTQHGLTIGVFNYARELSGCQLGVINVSDNGGHRVILPVLAVRQ